MPTSPRPINRHGTLPEHTPKQASYKEKAPIEWNVNDLLAWIKGKRPDLLDDDKSEKLRKAEISGEVFLACAGDKEFFKNDASYLPGQPWCSRIYRGSSRKRRPPV